MDQLSVFDVNTLKTLWSHWLGPDTPCSSEVQEGENKFSEVVEKQVFVKNVVYSKRGGKYFYFDFWGPIILVRNGDFGDGGVVVWQVRCGRVDGVWVSCGGDGGLQWSPNGFQ